MSVITEINELFQDALAYWNRDEVIPFHGSFFVRKEKDCMCMCFGGALIRAIMPEATCHAGLEDMAKRQYKEAIVYFDKRAKEKELGELYQTNDDLVKKYGVLSKAKIAEYVERVLA